MSRPPARPPARLPGIVKRIVRDKGFGFLQSPKGDDVFFHRSELPSGDFDRLTEGARVWFVRIETPKGPRAADMTIDDER